jgi:hypothetical protein
MEDKIDRRWRTSSYSGNGGGNCVEVAGQAQRVLVRDTRGQADAVLRFTPAAWRRFAEQLKRALATGLNTRASRRPYAVQASWLGTVVQGWLHQPGKEVGSGCRSGARIGR